MTESDTVFSVSLMLLVSSFALALFGWGHFHSNKMRRFEKLKRLIQRKGEKAKHKAEIKIFLKCVEREVEKLGYDFFMESVYTHDGLFPTMIGCSQPLPSGAYLRIVPFEDDNDEFCFSLGNTHVDANHNPSWEPNIKVHRLILDELGWQTNYKLTDLAEFGLQACAISIVEELVHYDRVWRNLEPDISLFCLRSSQLKAQETWITESIAEVS